MMGFLAWIVRSRTARVGMAALLGLMRIFSPVGGGVIALTVLRYGWVEGIVTAFLGWLVLAAVGYGVMQDSIMALVVFTVVLWCIVIALAALLRRTSSLAMMIQAATLMGVLVVLGFFALQHDPVAFWTSLLDKWMVPALNARFGAGSHDWAPIIHRVAVRMTGVIGASVALSGSLAVLCGRWAQATLYNPGGFKAAFHQLRMGRAATIAASIVFVLAGVLDNVLIGNLAIVLLIMFMYQGLAILHGVAGKRRWRRGWLVAFYIIFALEAFYVLAIVAGAGLIDNWFDIRARVARQT